MNQKSINVRKRLNNLIVKVAEFENSYQFKDLNTHMAINNRLDEIHADLDHINHTLRMMGHTSHDRVEVK